MQNDESLTPLLPAIEVAEKSSPFLPNNLFDLLFRPERFFARLESFHHMPYIYLCAWLYGIITAMSRFERFGLQGERSPNFELWEMVSTSWSQYWIWGIALGVISALVAWGFGGWWYRLRIRWSGDDNPDPYEVRLIYFYSGLVVAVPTILLILYYTLSYPDYVTATLEPNPVALLLLFLPFWGVFIGYMGVRTRFRIIQWQGLIWIVLLPLVQHSLGIIAVIASVWFSS